MNTDIYNGVDVKKVGQGKNGIINYLAKYISKNNIEFYRLPWHCSRNVSRLFTSTTFEDDVEDNYYKKIPESMEHYSKVVTDNLNYSGVEFKFKPDERLYEDLDSVKEIVYNLRIKSTPFLNYVKC